MAKMTLEELRNLRDSKRKEINRRKVDEKTVEVIVGMGTSGIAAGAKHTLQAFITALEHHDLKNVVIRQTGSLGLDHAEPTVEVHMQGMPDTIYGSVTPEVAEEIVEKHILKKELVNKHVFDRPAPDMIKE
ncbi:NAD(P)-dependent iron-only hydrogenase iron-sulfur protein [Alkalispirochaeta sphaeroplastigenens]|uniref:NAD(P)-dependent iron-only hydrogenase iron-sulfur protein n=1 Tax=Alkalispirochaeta sphaeroplastigenens TaxID=1187066 RepID=A0A2S4JWN1_9SPIO|nr:MULTISPECIES: (2Fe-2S) ferredoxin domain-containing protein [Alkalispirochaeta]POR03937.1 NAD(P)-dependent iron-only hydrogenase iron-sulfur protein [Alkalispirochaeta sphaeroplastigenens]